MHTPQSMETQYYPINTPDRPILIHAHASGPYMPSLEFSQKALDFVIYSSGSIGCNTLGFSLAVDWPTTLGRWALRYPTTLITWSIGIVSIILFTSWGIGDFGGGKSVSRFVTGNLCVQFDPAMPSVGQSLFIYSRRTLSKLLLTSVLVALLPIPPGYYLGTGGEILFAPIAPVLVLLASGLVFVSWGLLKCLIWLLAMLKRFIPGRSVGIFTDVLV